jgi:DNA-binding GntR family transcriptional regulator
VTTHWGLATVERRSTREQVLQELRAAIIDGRIGPRAPLREVALAEAFGTGRSAIREALSALAQEGLVVSELNRGTWVRELSCADVVDVYRAREAIETAAVAAALERGAVDLVPLRRALDELRTVSDRDGFVSPPQALIAADIDFHRTLVALAQSPRLSRAHEPLAAESQMLLNWHPVYSGSDYADDHQGLLDAFADPGDAAVVAVRDHLRLTEDLIVGELEQYSSRVVATIPATTGTAVTMPAADVTQEPNR